MAAEPGSLPGMRIALLIALACPLAAAERPRGLIAPDAVVTEIATGYALIGGLAAGQDGQVYFSDVPSDSILMRLADGTTGTWLEDSGGANGLHFFGGQVFAAQGVRRQVVTIDAGKAVTSLSYQHAGKRFNAPDDLWIDDEGGVYFTDPRAGAEGEHVFYIAPGVAEARPVAQDFTRPNGIVGTPNGRSLYVADDDGGTVFKFNIAASGRLVDRMKFCPEGSDGMCLDEKGNLYLTWKMGVQVYAPDGSKLGTIPMPVDPTDVCFGGPTRSTLFISGGGKLHSLAMAVRGPE